jgi:hypothetical protein
VLDRARENIERHFFFIGEQEHFRADVRGLGRLLGWRVPPLAYRNVGSYRRYRVSPEDLDFLRQLTGLDLALWREIRAHHVARRRPTVVERGWSRLEAAGTAVRRRVRGTLPWRMIRALLRRRAAVDPPRAASR